MGRPAKKRCRAEAKATRLGILQAEYEFEKAHSVTKKPMDFLEGHIEKQIDKTDWIEAGAIGIGTILIHGLVASDKNLVKHILQTFSSASLGIGAWGITAWLTEEAVMRFMNRSELGAEKEAQRRESLRQTGEPSSEQPKTESPSIPDWQLWAASFFCAYIICKYGGQLVGLLEKGLTSVVPMLLGAA